MEFDFAKGQVARHGTPHKTDEFAVDRVRDLYGMMKKFDDLTG
jgi:hypothetical protein